MSGWLDASAGFAVTGTVDTAAPPAGRAATALSPALLPAAVAAALALVAIALRWRGSDLPAHFFRVAIVERDGFEIWNNQWFGGHHTLGYGALFPVLGAAFGIWTGGRRQRRRLGVPRRRADPPRARAAAACRRRCGSPPARSPTWRSAACRSPSAWPSASARSSRRSAAGPCSRPCSRSPPPRPARSSARSSPSSSLAWAWSSDGRLRVRWLVAVGAVDRCPVLLDRRALPAGRHVPVPLAGAVA